MNTKENEWHDLVRKHVDNVEQAKENLEFCIQMTTQMATQALDRKLLEGFEVTKPLHLNYVHFIEVLKKESKIPEYATGGMYMELRYSAMLREKPCDAA